MRLINAVRELRVETGRDLRTIAMHTAAERTAMFVREADEAVCIDIDRAPGEGSPYLDLAALERALVDSKADAAWVGWGFVAERPEFAELCEKLGIVFVGPSAEVMRRLGDKIGSKLLAEQADVPVAGWSGGPVGTLAEARVHAATIGYPLMIKATAGGGGRGIRRVDAEADLAEAFESARSEGGKAFGDPTVFMERVVTGCPARRGPVDRRHPWHRLGGRRPRLQHAAAQPEGDRGVALHRPDPGAGRRPARRRRAPGDDRRVPQRRHRRVPLPAERAALRLPRGQHAAAGRAPGHRADHRPRPRQAPTPGRRGRTPRGRTSAERRVRDRSAAQRRGPAAGVRPGAGDDRDAAASGRTGRPRRHGRRRGRRDPARVRLDDRQDHRPRPRPRGGARPAPPRPLADDGGRPGWHDEQVVPARPARASRGPRRVDRHVVARPADRSRRAPDDAPRRRRPRRRGAGGR